MFLAVIGMRNERVGEHAGILGEIVRSKIEFRQRIERGAGHATRAERIEHMHILSEGLAAFRRDARVFALRIDDKRRTFVEEQIRYDERNALARTAARNRHDMPVVVPADQTPGAAAKQEASLMLPLLVGHLHRSQPTCEQGPLPADGFGLLRMTARQVLAQTLLELVTLLHGVPAIFSSKIIISESGAPRKRELRRPCRFPRLAAA